MVHEAEVLHCAPCGVVEQPQYCAGDIEEIEGKGRRPEFYKKGFCSIECFQPKLVDDDDVQMICKKCNGPIEKKEGKGNRPKWYKAGFCGEECFE